MVLRKLAVALLGVGVLLPGLSHALAIGDIKTRSALNEPFLGEVVLSDVGDLSADEIRVDMATPEEFRQMGVDWSSQLSELHFQVLKKEDGSAVIRVTSNHPVTEPDLDFVLRVSWPGNTSMREFVALLDLPSAKVAASPVATPAVSAPTTVAPAAAPQAEQPSPASSTTTSRPRAQNAPRQVRSRSGENLWSIAHHWRPAKVSTEQMMIALQKRNPDAFPGANINQLAADRVLVIPSLEEIRRINARDADAEVERQDQAWRRHQPDTARSLEKEQVSAQPLAEPAAAAAGSQGQVHLLAPGSQDKAHAAAQIAGNAKVAQVEQENTQLKQALQQDQDKLQAQLQQIKVQDAKLAELEQALKLHQQQDKKPLAAPQAPAPVVKPPVQPRVAQAPSAPAAAPAPAPVVKASLSKPPVKPPVTPALPLAPVPEATATSSSHIVLWGAAALAALAALVGGLIARRRRHESQQIHELTRNAPQAESLSEHEGLDLPLDEPVDDLPLDDLHDYAGAENVAPEQDAMVEAHGLMQRQLYPQAIGVLSKALRQQPQRDDLRIMMMEALAEVGDHEGFAEQESQIQAGDLETLEIVEELRGRLPQVRSEEAPLVSLHQDPDVALDFAQPQSLGASAEPAAASPASAAVDDLADLDFDLQDLDFAQQPASAAPSAEVHDDPLDLDFVPSLGSASSPPASSDRDGEPMLEPVAQTEVALEPHEALDHDLDLGLDDALHFDAEPAPEPAGSDGLVSAVALNFGEPLAEEVSTPVAAHDDSLDLDALDLDLSALDEPEPALQASAGSPQDSLAADEELAALELDELPSVDELESFALDDDFDLEHESGGADIDLASLREGQDEEELPALMQDEPLNHPAEYQPAAAHEADSDFSAAEFDLALPVQGIEASEPASVDAAAGDEEVATEAAAEESFDLGAEFDFLADADENATKIDLARAYIDMGDAEGARDILQEVIEDGNNEQQEEARTLLTQVG